MLTSGAEDLGGKDILEFFLPQVHSDLSWFSYQLKAVTGDYSNSHFILFSISQLKLSLNIYNPVNTTDHRTYIPMSMEYVIFIIPQGFTMRIKQKLLSEEQVECLIHFFLL